MRTRWTDSGSKPWIVTLAAGAIFGVGVASHAGQEGSPPSCTASNPISSIVTLAKGQGPANNAKLSHVITGNIIDAGSLGPTAHRIEVCVGTEVTAVVTDTSGTPTNTAMGSLSCDSAKCSGVVTTTEKYQSISQDGRDRDSISFIPR